MYKIAIKTAEIVCFVALASFLLAGCGMTLSSGGMIPQGALNFTNNGSVFDSKMQGRLSEFKPSDLRYEPAPYVKPIQDMPNCIKQGKRDGWTDSDIVTWCIQHSN